nr:Sister chromatid cohesion protein 2 [Polyrhizophydium stewartii]
MNGRAENLSHSDAAALAAGLCVTQSTHALRDSIVHCICSGIGADSVALRTRALKSLQEVLVGNSSLLLTSSIRRVIGERLLDSSANVRDAAVDVLGKYVLAGGDETLKQYYPVLCDRVMDVSPIVRKRTLRLLRDFCASVGELAEPTDAHADMAVDVTVRMLGRMHDDSSVADLAFKCFSELWLQTARPVDVADAAAWQALAETEKAAVRWIVRCLTRVASKSNAVSMLLGETLTKAVKSATKQTRPALHAHVHALVLCTVDQLLVSYEQSRMDGIVAHLALLLRLSDIAPELVSPHLFTLHPFIKPSRAAHAPNSPEAAQELQIVQSVLVIFVNVLPMIREPDPTLVAAVETDLLQLLNRSPQGVIQSAVPCVCTIVAKHTRNVAKLARVVVTCYDMLEKHKAVCEQTGSLPPNSLRTAWRCMILLSLVLRYYDFSDDKNMRGEYNIPEIQAIAKGTPLSTRAFDLIHSFIARSSSPETTIVVLTCLGNLFMSHPRLMLTDTTIALFSRVFAGKDAKEKRQLLVILAEFLEREQTAKAERPGEMADRAVLTSDPFAPPSKKARRDEQPIDMSVLVGNAEEFAEAGIASSIVQRFLQPVIDCVLSGHAQLLSTGFQVLQLIVDQGLVHPILVVPALCAIASLDDAVLATRAASLHQRLAEKHASFIHSKNMEAVRCIYEFHGRQLYVGGAKPQSALVPGHVVVSLQTETGTAAHLESRIARVYALVRPTRNKRNEFLRGLVRLFEVDKKESRIESLGFLLFVADCLVVLDYKTTDEVLLVLHCINRILSLAGDASFDEARELADDAAEQHTAPLMARVLVLTALMIVRHQLQQCYGLTDARCVAYNPASVTSKAAEKPLGHPVTPVAAVDWRQILTSSALKWPAAAEQIAQCKRAEAFASRIAAHAVADAGGGGGDTSSNASAGYRNGFSSDATGPSDEDDAASEHRRRLPDTIAVGGASDAASGAAGQPAKRRRTDGRGQQKQQHIKLKQQKPLVAPPPPLRRGGKRDATGRVARGDGFGLLSSETDGDVDPLTAGSGLAGDVSGTAGRGGGASKRRRSSIVAS